MPQYVGLLKLQVLSLVLMLAVLTHWALDCTGAEPGTNSALRMVAAVAGAIPCKLRDCDWQCA